MLDGVLGEHDDVGAHRVEQVGDGVDCGVLPPQVERCHPEACAVRGDGGLAIGNSERCRDH